MTRRNGRAPACSGSAGQASFPGDGMTGAEAGRTTDVAISQPQKKHLFDNGVAVGLACNAFVTLI